MTLCCRMSCGRFAEPAEKVETHMYFFMLLLKKFMHCYSFLSLMLQNVRCLLVSAVQLLQLRRRPTRLLDSGDVLVMDEAVEGDHLQEKNDKEELRPLTRMSSRVSRVIGVVSFWVTSRVSRRDQLVDQGLRFGEFHRQLPALEHGPVERLDG